MTDTQTDAPTAHAGPTLSIIMVSYNTREMTLACIDSVFEETRETDFELIVLDNASEDGSADAIAERFPNLHLIRSDENLGFARANNVAARHARGDYLLLLNPDMLVLRGALDTLTAFARARPEAKIWGGRTLFGDESLNPTSCWRDMGLWTLFCRAFGLPTFFPNSALFNSEAYGGWKRDTTREVDIVTGCLFLLKRSFWEELGGFDLSFEMYAEEADLCYRARKAGARPAITPDVEVVHYGGASEKVRADKLVRIARAKVTLMEKHWSPWRRQLGRVLFLAWALTRRLATGLARAVGMGGASYPVWSEVWARRGEWIDGFTLHPHPVGDGRKPATQFREPG